SAGCRLPRSIWASVPRHIDEDHNLASLRLVCSCWVSRVRSMAATAEQAFLRGGSGEHDAVYLVKIKLVDRADIDRPQNHRLRAPGKVAEKARSWIDGAGIRRSPPAVTRRVSGVVAIGFAPSAPDKLSPSTRQMHVKAAVVCDLVAIQ